MEEGKEFVFIGDDYIPIGSIKISPEQLVGFCANCPDISIPGNRFKSMDDLSWLSCPCCGGNLIWRREPQESPETAPDV